MKYIKFTLLLSLFLILLNCSKDKVEDIKSEDEKSQEIVKEDDLGDTNSSTTVTDTVSVTTTISTTTETEGIQSDTTTETYSTTTTTDDSTSETKGSEGVKDDNFTSETKGSEGVKDDNFTSETKGSEGVKNDNSTSETKESEGVKNDNSTSETKESEGVKNDDSTSETKGSEGVKDDDSTSETKGAEGVKKDDSTSETKGSEGVKKDDSTTSETKEDKGKKDETTGDSKEDEDKTKEDEVIIIKTENPKVDQEDTNTGSNNSGSIGSGAGSGNQEPAPSPELTISPNDDSYTFSSEVNQKKITFIPKNGYEYIVEITDGNWLIKEHSNDVYTFRLSENSLTIKREATITIKNKKDNSIFKTIKVTQEGKKNISENNFLDNVKWVDGIVPPTEWDTSKGRPIAYEKSGNGSGWYDINKENPFYTGGSDIVDSKFCYLVTASNMIHWWYDRNQENIKKFKDKGNQVDDIIYNIDKEKSRSSIYNILKKSFWGNKGGYTDSAIRWYFSNVNYIDKRQQREEPLAIFKEVIPSHELAYTSSLRAGSVSEFSKIVKERLDNGDILGISYNPNGRPNGYLAHIITLWGARFNEQGLITEIFVTDSDDHNLEHNMYALKIYGKNGKTYFPNLGGTGAEIYNIVFLEQGKKYWNKWLSKNP